MAAFFVQIVNPFFTMTDKPTFRQRIANYIFGDIIDQAAKDAAAAVSIRIDDSRGWDQIAGGTGPADRPWSEFATDLQDAHEAWRKNFLIRRIVNLCTSYVVGNGITVTSKDPDVDEFIRTFWKHPKNRMAQRLGPMCNELTRAGELFPVLFTNKVDGMSYLRFVPASQILHLETDKEDYETELRYGQIQRDTVEIKWWTGPDHPSAYKPRYHKLTPLMLHFAVNREIGATRGEGDLGPILPWAKRYTEWLKDRVRLNRQRTRQGVLDVQIPDDTQVEAKRKQLRTSNPIEHGIYVHGPDEKTTMHNLEIKADDVKDDGWALRLAIATGANTALHYLSEGTNVNYATAKEMGEPTARFYTDRQTAVCGFLENLVTAAYHRRCAILEQTAPPDLQLITSTTEVARADNKALADAAHTIVQALRDMRDVGWIDDTTAIRLAFKFAGETIGEDEIKRILAQAQTNANDTQPSTQEE
jgi:hypothetical protein